MTILEILLVLLLVNGSIAAGWILGGAFGFRRGKFSFASQVCEVLLQILKENDSYLEESDRQLHQAKANHADANSVAAATKEAYRLSVRVDTAQEIVARFHPVLERELNIEKVVR